MQGHGFFQSLWKRHIQGVNDFNDPFDVCSIINHNQHFQRFVNQHHPGFRKNRLQGGLNPFEITVTYRNQAHHVISTRSTYSFFIGADGKSFETGLCRRDDLNHVASLPTDHRQSLGFKDFFKKEKSIFRSDLKIRRGSDRHLPPQDLFLVDKDGIRPHRDDFNEFLEYKILWKINRDFIILPCCLKSERVQGKNQHGQKNPADASGFRLRGCEL